MERNAGTVVLNIFKSTAMVLRVWSRSHALEITEYRFQRHEDSFGKIWSTAFAE